MDWIIEHFFFWSYAIRISVQTHCAGSNLRRNRANIVYGRLGKLASKNMRVWEQTKIKRRLMELLGHTFQMASFY